jgi:hypothetical protein
MRRWLAKLIYPEIFNTCRGLRIDNQEKEEALERYKEVIKKNGRLITVDLNSGRFVGEEK